MALFIIPILLLIAPPVLLARWGLIKMGVKDPSDGQIQALLFGVVLIVIWVSGIWLAP